MLRQITRAGDLSTKVAKQLQKVGEHTVHVRSVIVLSINHPKTQILCNNRNSNYIKSGLVANTRSIFGLFQSTAVAGTQKSNNYATEATVQVQRVSSAQRGYITVK